MKNRFALLLLMVFASGGMFSNVYAAIPAIEREALIALYNSTNGDSWTDNSGWKTPPLDTDGFAMPGTEDDWYGVFCDPENIAVQVIGLVANHLYGTIPPELGNLSRVWLLELSENQLTGSIPPELGNLSRLWYLFLSENQLCGSIPSELGNLASLLRLYVSENQLSGTIPAELGNLALLSHLDLNNNLLNGPLPDELLNLSNLVNNENEFCNNYLYTDNATLRDFLNTKQTGGDWESCQNSLEPIPTVSEWGMIIFMLLLITSGMVVIRRREQ